MMMRDVLTLIFAGGAGLGIGAFFFGGLWWTVRRSVVSPRPAVWLFGSLLVRMGVTLTAFYFVITSQPFEGQWQPLLACMLGFIVARVISRILVTRMTRLPAANSSHSAAEVRHAP